MGEARISVPLLRTTSSRPLAGPHAPNIRSVDREQVYICKREVSLYSFSRKRSNLALWIWFPSKKKKKKNKRKRREEGKKKNKKERNEGKREKELVDKRNVYVVVGLDVRSGFFRVLPRRGNSVYIYIYICRYTRINVKRTSSCRNMK